MTYDLFIFMKKYYMTMEVGTYLQEMMMPPIGCTWGWRGTKSLLTTCHWPATYFQLSHLNLSNPGHRGLHHHFSNEKLRLKRPEEICHRCEDTLHQSQGANQACLTPGTLCPPTLPVLQIHSGHSTY